jgi:hypothetical protein
MTDITQAQGGIAGVGTPEKGVLIRRSSSKIPMLPCKENDRRRINPPRKPMLAGARCFCSYSKEQ